MKKPSPYQIMAFVHAAREASFSRAAGILGVSQSSVTQHVAKLEDAIGMQLFIRRRDGLELTRSGRELFDLADRWMALQLLFEERVNDYSSMNLGHLKITATAPRPALPLIAAFNRRYPKVTIDFSLLNWTQSMLAIKERTIDIAIVTEPTRADGVHYQKIATRGYRAFMRSDHPFASRGTLCLQELSDALVIIPEDGSFTQRIVFETAKRHGVVLNRLIKMGTFAVVKEAILHGLGIGLLLDESVHDSTRLVSLPVVELGDSFSDYVVIPKEKQNLRLISRFMEGIDVISCDTAAHPEPFP